MQIIALAAGFLLVALGAAVSIPVTNSKRWHRRFHVERGRCYIGGCDRCMREHEAAKWAELDTRCTAGG